MIKKKRRKKSERQKIVDKLDTLFSKVVRTRDRYSCQKDKCTCLNNKYTQCCHIWGRRSEATRWDEKNAITMCYYHHLTWAHHEPLEFSEWIKKKIGSKLYYALRKKSETPTPQRTVEQLGELYDELKEKLAYYDKRNTDEPF